MGAPKTARFFFFPMEMIVVQSTAQLVLRAADVFDAAALAQLRLAGLAEMGLLPPGNAPAFAARARREFWTMLRAERLAAWVLSVDERVAGCACVLFWERLPYPETSLHAEIAGVYVDPAFRRRGVARELVREVTALARSRGARRIVLQPTPQTRALYRELGFGESGQMRM